jgi:hypothetical protein
MYQLTEGVGGGDQREGMGLLEYQAMPSLHDVAHDEWLVTFTTVGAQSLACAQSIACGHIGDNICQKNKIIEKLCLHKIKRGNSAADS